MSPAMDMLTRYLAGDQGVITGNDPNRVSGSITFPAYHWWFAKVDGNGARWWTGGLN